MYACLAVTCHLHFNFFFSVLYPSWMGGSFMAPIIQGVKTCALGPQWVPGEIKRSRDLRGGRWSWTLKFAQKRSWVGRWSWAEQVGHLLLRVVQVVRQQQCNGHCLSDCPAQQLKQQLRSAQVAGQWRGDTALTLPLFWRLSTVSPVFFGRSPRSSLHSVVPFQLCPRP